MFINPVHNQGERTIQDVYPKVGWGGGRIIFSLPSVRLPLLSLPKLLGQRSLGLITTSEHPFDQGEIWFLSLFLLEWGGVSESVYHLIATWLLQFESQGLDDL